MQGERLRETSKYVGRVRRARGRYFSALALWHMVKTSYRLILIRTLYLEEEPEYDFQKP